MYIHTLFGLFVVENMDLYEFGEISSVYISKGGIILIVCYALIQ